MKRIDLQPAYILHTRPYRDTSLLVDLLTLDHGLLRAVARGARGGSSRKRTAMQPFQPVLVSLAGKSDLLSMNQVEHAAPGFQLGGDRLFSAMYMNELLLRLLQAQEAQPPIYRLYQNALLGLQQQHNIELTLRRFEFNLLNELGYAWDLESDMVDGSPLSEHACYLFDPEHGYEQVIPPPANWPPTLYRGRDLILFAGFCGAKSLDMAEQQLHEDTGAAARLAAKRLMRQALQPHLGSRPLLSRSLFAVKAASSGTPDSSDPGPVLPPEANKG